jgi:hypothetical protein
MQDVKPVIGLPVQFVSTDSRDEAKGHNIHAATIVRVNEDGTVNLKVFLNGNTTPDRWVTNISAEGQDSSASRFWRLPQ